MFKNRIVSELMAAARGKRSDESLEGREESSQLQDQVRNVVSGAERFIASNPMAAIGTAVVAGVLLGWWVKRK